MVIPLSLAQNANRIEPILRRANALYNHPLLRRLAEGSGDSLQEKQRDIGMQMMAARIGSPLLMECIRLLDEAKQRATATNSGLPPTSVNNYSFGTHHNMVVLDTDSGWGSRSSDLNPNLEDNASYLEFLGTLKSFLLKKYAAGMWLSPAVD